MLSIQNLQLQKLSGFRGQAMEQPSCQRGYNYTVFSTTFPEKAPICSHFFVLFSPCFCLCLLEEETAGAAHAKSIMILGLVPSWCIPPSNGMKRAPSLAKNLWDAGGLSSFSDGGEARKQLWHLQADSGFAQECDAWLKVLPNPNCSMILCFGSLETGNEELRVQAST